MTHSSIQTLPDDCVFLCLNHLGPPKAFCFVSKAFLVRIFAWLHSRDGSKTLWIEGIALVLGIDNKTINEVQGQQLIVAAATFGFPTAIAYNFLEGWDPDTGIDHGKAFRILMKDALEHQYAWSEFLVGYCLYHGYGDDNAPNSGSRQPNHVAAVEWYRRAVKQNLCVAQNHLALMIMNDEGGLETPDWNWENSIVCQLLWNSAIQGNCRGMFGWAMSYVDHGKGITGDDLQYFAALDTLDENENNLREWWCSSEKREMMVQSYEQGQDEATYEIALYLRYRHTYAPNNESTKIVQHFRYLLDTSDMHINERKIDSFKLMKRASMDGHPVAQCTLAKLYELQGNWLMAREWFEKSARNRRSINGKGIPEAMHSLGTYYLHGKGELKPDLQIALAWFRLASRYNHEMALFDAQTLENAGVVI
jgi:TPR repeat protein